MNTNVEKSEAVLDYKKIAQALNISLTSIYVSFFFYCYLLSGKRVSESTVFVSERNVHCVNIDDSYWFKSFIYCELVGFGISVA